MTKKIYKIENISSHLELENTFFAQGAKILAGVDEAGVGCWAGPVYAGAVALKPNQIIPGARDSKKLSPKAREELAIEIKETATAWAVGTASVEEINTLNILQATLLAMKRAVLALSVKPDELLVDYRQLDLGIPCHSYIKGDDISHIISCASIIAKTSRDALLVEYDQLYPEYGFANHKGYGTAAHLEAIKKYGILPIHRTSYKPLQKLMAPKQLSLDSF